MAGKRKASFFVAFEKVDKQDDGTIIVSGVASSEAVDSDGEIITAEAMKAALPDYMKFANIREMHLPIAAGTALKCEVDGAGVTHLEARIVDPTTCLKIEEDVLKGFSIGGRVTARDPLNKAVITGIRLSEISVVDRPANPEALFTLGKVDGADEPDVALGVLRKGLYEVSRLADLLQSLAWVAQNVACEAEWEADGSPIPAALQAAVAAIGAALKEMTVEEVDELMAYFPAPAASVEVVQLTEKLAKAEAEIEGLAKRGAKYSKATKAAIRKLRKATADANECMKAFEDVADEDQEGEDDDEEADKGAGVEDLQKAQGAAQEALSKVATLEADLAKANGTITELTDEVARLANLPEPARGVLKAFVDKGDEVTLNGLGKVQKAQVDELQKINEMPDGPDKAKALIAFTHKTGGR